MTNKYAAAHRLSFEEAVRRFYALNISKLDDFKKPFLNDEGKVIKGINNCEPDMSASVEVANER